MKKFILIAGILLIACASFAGDYQIVVPAATSYKLAPERRVKPTAVWVTSTAVVQGATVVSGSQWYMAVHAGTTGATAPTHLDGIVTDGTVLWLQYNKKDRTEIIVVQESDSDVWYHDKSPAVASGGAYAYLKGQSYYDESNRAVFAYYTLETNANIKDR